MPSPKSSPAAQSANAAASAASWSSSERWGRGVQKRLGVGIGPGRAGRKASREPVDGVVEPVLRHDAVDQPHRPGFLGAETLAEIGHLEAPLHADGARQGIGRGPIRADPYVAIGEGEESVLMRHREVAGGHQAHAEPRHRAVHGGDRRFRHRPDRLDRRVHPVNEGLETGPPFLPVRHLVEPRPEDRDVAAGHEVVSGAPDHDASDVLVRRRRLGHDVKCVRHVAVDRVEGFGPAERYRAHAVRDGCIDGIVRRTDHVGSSREVSGTGREDGMYGAATPAAKTFFDRVRSGVGCRPGDFPSP